MHPRIAYKKIRLIGVILFLGVIIILSRLVYLQVILNENLFIRSQKNFLRFETVPSLRGNILDCNGNLLATNRPINTLFWHGTGNKQLTLEQEMLIQTIEILCTLPIPEQSLYNSIKRAERTLKRIAICSDMAFEQLCKITELYPNHPNLYIETEYKRFYPHKNLACHLLGYIGHNLESIGKMGLEKSCESLLRGQEGLKLKTINSMGTNLSEKQIRETLSGANITTTLDLSLQTLAESVFPAEETGALLLLDPQTGAIKALVSRPDFDPSMFLEQLSQDQWSSVQEKQPFLNRALCACYPPASLFKLVTIAMGIELKLIDPEQLWFCRGFTTFGNRRYHCKRREGHGYITPQQAVEKSCNTLFYSIGTQINIDMLASYAQKFGLGQKTSIILPEKEGLIPTAAWKKKVKRERWWAGETLSAVIGQSYLLVTPIQIARMISSIFQGYLVKPRIIQTEEIERQLLEIGIPTQRFLKKAMKQVAVRGTASLVGHYKNIKLYAKTGTAQTAHLDKIEHKEHGWFVLYIKPENADPLTLVIIIERAGSSRPPVMVAKNFLRDYSKILNKKTN